MTEVAKERKQGDTTEGRSFLRVCEPALLHDDGAAAGAVGGHGQRAALDSHVVGHTHEVDATVRDLGTGSGWLVWVVWTAEREKKLGEREMDRLGYK